MGNVTLSSRVDSSTLSGNAYLQRLISPEPLDASDPFWLQLLSFQMRTPKQRPACKDLEDAARESLKRFCANNPKSGNLGQLVKVLADKKRELKTATETDAHAFLWQTFNAIFLLKICLKYMVEVLKEDEVARQIAVDPKRNVAEGAAHENGAKDVEEGPTLEMLIEILVDIVTELALQ
jgi:hypothetical protein